MDLSQINDETIDLLTRITNKKLKQEDITPLLIFLAALITVLLGVIFADAAVAYSEEQRLQKNLDAFVPMDENLQNLTQLMIGGIDWHHVYINPSDWLLLTAPLSYPERLLIMGLGYEMSAADGNIDPRETMYLREVGGRLGIASKQLLVLEMMAKGKDMPRDQSLDEVRELLNPGRFQNLDPAFVQVAAHLSQQLQS